MVKSKKSTKSLHPTPQVAKMNMYEYEYQGKVIFKIKAGSYLR